MKHEMMTSNSRPYRARREGRPPRESLECEPLVFPLHKDLDSPTYFVRTFEHERRAWRPERPNAAERAAHHDP
jgi:hypothetical protein